MSEQIPLTLPVRLIQLVNRIKRDEVLNPESASGDMPPDLPQSLAQQFLALKTSYFHDNVVDYSALRTSEDYQHCKALTAHFRHFDPLSLPDEQAQRAWWINVYNALIVTGVIEYDVSKSMWEVRGFLSRIAFNINGYRFSANDIEFGILRSNAGHPFIPGPQFRSDDPRARYILPLDPRIHFALNCASYSCPPIAVYTADGLDGELDLSAQAFINGGGAKIDMEACEVSLSAIFSWYRSDFLRKNKPKTGLLSYVSRYIRHAGHREALANCPQDFKITFQKYDWSLNRAA